MPLEKYDLSEVRHNQAIIFKIFKMNCIAFSILLKVFDFLFPDLQIFFLIVNYYTQNLFLGGIFNYGFLRS